MAKPQLLPSAHVPDFLRGDWQIGTAASHPLPNALDEMSLSLCALHIRMTYRIHPELGDEQHLTEALLGCGFQTATLSLDDKRALRRDLKKLFRARGTLHSVERLAAIYFGQVDVRRGRPHRFDRLDAGRSSAWGVGEMADRDRLVFVRLSRPVSVARVREFQNNARTLLPDGFEIEIAQPGRQAEPARAGWALRSDRATKRRL